MRVFSLARASISISQDQTRELNLPYCRSPRSEWKKFKLVGSASWGFLGQQKHRSLQDFQGIGPNTFVLHLKGTERESSPLRIRTMYWRKMSQPISLSALSGDRARYKQRLKQ